MFDSFLLFEPTNFGAGLGYPYSRVLTDITHSWN
jgi:hypothetical protein